MTHMELPKIASLLDDNRQALVSKLAASAHAGASPGAICAVVVCCDDRFAQSLFYACGGEDGKRFMVGDVPGSAIAILGVAEVSAFLEIADQLPIVHSLRSPPPGGRYWAISICDGVLLESFSTVMS